MDVPAKVEIRRSKAGRTLHGVVIQEGRAAKVRREVFAPGSVTWPAEGMGVMARHSSSGGRVESRGVPVRDANGIIRIEAPATPALREAVAAGRQFMSVEFVPLEERRTTGGIREIVRAFVPRVALMDDPEYIQTGVEVRQRRGGYITEINPSRRADCRCAGQGANAHSVEYGDEAFDRLLREVEEGDRIVSAISRGADSVIADTNTGSLRLAMRNGLFEIVFEPLDTEAGRRTRELLDAGVRVDARPVIDFDASRFEVTDDVARISEALFSFILVKPTPNTAGLEPLRPHRRREERRHADGESFKSALDQYVGALKKGRRVWL